jgi:geranylgeranyl diphosphate synthase, type I
MNKSLQDFVNQHKPMIDDELASELTRRIDEVTSISPHLTSVVQAMQELSVGGKRLRGLLTILGYRLSGQEVTHEIIRAAVVMELFHLGLLMQDDVMDRDSLRRGVTTIHARYDDLHLGEAMAVLAGDFTFGWGMEMLCRESVVISDQARVAAMSVWGKYFTRVGYGQALDVMKVADEESLIQILALKSGEYSCVLPLVFGATFGGAKTELIEALTKYGMELGWVFQLRDDYLAEWGVSSKTGKPVGNDSREGKHSFALMYGRDRLEKEIVSHASLAKAAVRGDIREGEDILNEIVDWVAKREN